MAALLPVLTTSLLALASQARDAPSLADVEKLIAQQQGRASSLLVRLTRSDEFFLNTFGNLGKKLHAAGRITDAQFACLDQLKQEDYNQVLSVTLALEYDEPTLRQVFEFYSSPVGARFMRMVYEKHWRQTPDDFPLPPEHDKEFMTLREFREIATFRQSGVPAVFQDPAMVTQWDDARKVAATLWRVQTVKCGVPDDVIGKAIPSAPSGAGGGE